MPPPSLPSLSDATELQAAEFALGLNDPAERAAAEQRLGDDPDFAAAVARWEERVAPWFDDVSERAHSATLHDRIMAALPAASPIAANDNSAEIRRSRGLWRGAALLMTAATLALAFTLMLRAPAEPTEIATAPAPMLLATLALPDSAAISLSVDQATGRIMATPVGIVPDGIHSHELWLVPGAGTPRSMGLVDAAAAHSLTAATALLADLRAGAIIAVTAEPLGGSRQSGPSGPVLATAALQEI